MRRIALIPARAGSKSVPGKNMRVLGGVSLLARAVRCAAATGLFAHIHVSTDSEAYAEEAAREGWRPLFPRPNALSGDAALVADAIRHDLDALGDRGEAFDTLTLLEPSSPLRTPDAVAETVATAEAAGWDAAFTVSPAPAAFHAHKQFILDEWGAATLIAPAAGPNINRQSLPPTFIRNGLAYAVRTEAFLATHSIHGRRARALSVDGPAISIDTEADLKAAEAALAAREGEER